jgi:hypothetical protein
MGALMDWVITGIGVFSFNEWHVHVFVNRGERRRKKGLYCDEHGL